MAHGANKHETSSREWGSGPISSLVGKAPSSLEPRSTEHGAKRDPSFSVLPAPSSKLRAPRSVLPAPSPRLMAEILVCCERIYNRDRKRFAKLIVWVHSARKRKYEDRYILHALTILDKRESEGKPIAEWWPWCNRAIQYIRTRDKQGESQQYKKADFSSARAIMKELFKNL